MRCPKCGYISFDHLDACLKCNKDIKETAEKLQGSVYNVTAPVFLKFNQESEEEAMEMDEAFFDDDDAFGDEEIRDPDLDILLDEGEGGSDDVEFSLTDDEDELDEVAAEDDEEIDFQLDDFGDDAEIGGDDELASGDEEVNIDLPEELNDMADLEPPSLEKAAAEEFVEDGPIASLSTAGDDDGLDFEFNLDEDESPAGVSDDLGDVDLADLSLGGMDFEEEPAPAAEPQKKPESKKINLDDDFDFELDLGDLKLDDD